MLIGRYLPFIFIRLFDHLSPHFSILFVSATLNPCRLVVPLVSGCKSTLVCSSFRPALRPCPEAPKHTAGPAAEVLVITAAHPTWLTQGRELSPSEPRPSLCNPTSRTEHWAHSSRPLAGIPVAEPRTSALSATFPPLRRK